MALSDLFTGKNVKQAYDQAGARLGTAIDQYGNLTNQAGDILTTNYMKALEQWAPFQGAGTTALPAYLAGLGLAGPQGRDAAVSSYIQGPGVQNAITNAVGASNRAYNALGGQSGNAAAAASKIATDISLNDYYRNYMGGLLPLLNMGQGAAGAAGNIYTGLGGNLANLLTRQGDVGIAGAKTLGEFDVGKAGAENQGWANVVGLGLNLGKMFANPLGAIGGAAGSALGSGLFSGLTGGFGGQNFNYGRV